MKNFLNKISYSTKDIINAVAIFGVAGFVAYGVSKLVKKANDWDITLEDSDIVDFNEYR